MIFWFGTKPAINATPLEGGDVLPGFTLSIRDWFGEAERTAPR
jgi:hypothetical protein